MKQMLFAAGITAGFAWSAGADEVSLKPAFMSSHAECLDALQEFSWYCSKFEKSTFLEVYGDTYWKLTKDIPTPAFLDDFDEDGTRDLIVPTLVGCGTLGCRHDVLFGGNSTEEDLNNFVIVSDFAPQKTTCGGAPGLKFGEHRKCFPASEMKRRAAE